MTNSKLARVRVWDVPTRLFHWLLVTLILCAWISFEFNETFADPDLIWHRYNGYTLLILVLWRLLWGAVGSPASRFANFLHWPWNALRYGVDLIRWRERHYLGHNPLGSYMILALLALVATQGVFGLHAADPESSTWGPLGLQLSEETGLWFAKMHGWLFENVLLVFIALHIAANVLYRVVKKDQLIEAMVIGTKPAADYADQDVIATDAAGTRHSTLVRALVCLVLAIAIFAGTIVVLGGKLFY